MKIHSPPTRNSNARVVVVNPVGPHHCDRCRTSVNASNTSSRGASMTREITISRSAVAVSAGPSRPVAAIVHDSCSRGVLSFCTYASSRSKLWLQNRSKPPVNSWTGRSPRASRAYRRCLPALRSRTRPTSRSTLRCLEAPGWVIPSSWASSVTGRSPARSSTRISRRCGSAIALKTSDVVAARAMTASYADIGMRQVGGIPAACARLLSAGRLSLDMEAIRYLTDAERVRLLSRAESRLYDAGDVILAEGAYNEDVFILTGGTARVEVGGTQIARVGVGEAFGEMSLLDASPAMSDVIADDAVEA